jgi:hypothetical protein
MVVGKIFQIGLNNLKRNDMKQETLEEVAKEFYPSDEQTMERIAFKRGFTESVERVKDWVFVATLDGTPIASAHNKEQLEKLLDEYCGVEFGCAERICYKPYDSKFPSINDLEGTYTIKDSEGEYEVKVYGVKYLFEK